MLIVDFLEFYRRCIIAMRSILRVEQQDLVDKDENLSLSRTDALARELESERTHARNILDTIMNSWNIGDAYAEMRKGSWRDRGPLEDLGNISFT